MAVKKQLDAAGIKPALDPKKIGATFYRRNEVSRTQNRRARGRGIDFRLGSN